MAKYNENKGYVNKGNAITVTASLKRLTTDDLKVLWDFAENGESSQSGELARNLLKDPAVAKFQIEVEQFIVRRQNKQNNGIMHTRGSSSDRKLIIPGSVNHLTSEDLNALWDYAENGTSSKHVQRVNRLLKDPEVAKFQIEMEQFVVRRQPIIKPKSDVIAASVKPEQLAKRNDQEIQSISDKNTKAETSKEKYNVNILNKSTTMKNKFSLWREINNAINRKSPDDLATYYLQEGDKMNSELGLSISDGRHKHLYVPPSSRSALLASQVGGIESGPPILSIQNYIEAVSLGAQFFESILPLKRIPVFGAVEALTAGEGQSITEGTGSLSTLSMANNRISYSQPLSKLLLSLPAFEDIFIQNAMGGIGKKLMQIIFGVGARTATYGQGIGYKVTSGNLTSQPSFVPTHNLIESLVGELANEEMLTGKLAFLTSGKGRMILRSIQRELGSGGKYLLEDGKVSEYPCFISNSVSNIAGRSGDGALLIFANWQDLLIGQAGPWDICIDNVTRAKNHEVVITVTGYFDALGARGAVATSNAGQTDPYEFAKSFATFPIKFE